MVISAAARRYQQNDVYQVMTVKLCSITVNHVYNLLLVRICLPSIVQIMAKRHRTIK